MKQYQNLLSTILEQGTWKNPARENMPRTIGISHGTIEHDLNLGFPLLTTKAMYLKGIIHELLWFLRGETNIKYLVDNNVNIWNDDAYRWYLKMHSERSREDALTKAAFVNLIKNPMCDGKPELPYWTRNNGSRYTLGDLGKVYGYQWRNQNGVDQVLDVLNSLKHAPDSRYHIIDGWNKVDFKEMALPPCHLLYQFICRPISETPTDKAHVHNHTIYNITDDDIKPTYYLDLNMYQRSCDTFLGVPFNVASMAVLNIIMAKAVNMIPGKIYWTGGDTHLYENHMPMVQELLQRKPMILPKLKLNKHLITLADIESLTIDDFSLESYNSHPAIAAPLSTGL
jgi:thymidylate synthase